MKAEHLARFPAYVLGAVAGLTLLVFAACWIAMDGGFQQAWEILLGLRTPYGQATALGVALSALGYIAVPTAIGIGVADMLTRFTRRRLGTLPDAKDDIAGIVEDETGSPTGVSAP